MSNESKEKVFSDLIYLLYCAVNGKSAEVERLNNMNLGAVAVQAERHMLCACIYQAIAPLEKQLKDTDVHPVVQKLAEKSGMAIRKTILHDTERSRLFQFMDRRGIAHMSLKGIVLKNLYPKFGMREMSDNDIWFDSSYRSDVRDYFTDQGYKVISYNKSHHDAYEKDPVYNFEMHVELIQKISSTVSNNYYKNLKERLIRVTKPVGDSFEYRFNDEDFYIYMMVHANKHFNGAGNGLRSLLDTYVYLMAKACSMDMEYISNETDKLGLKAFEENMRVLSQKVFGSDDFKDKLTEQEMNMLMYLCGAGVYGNTAQRVENKLAGIEGRGVLEGGRPAGLRARMVYLRNRVFPDQEFMAINYPFVTKFRFLIIAAWLHRIAKAGMEMCRGSSRLKTEWKTVKRK